MHPLMWALLAGMLAVTCITDIRYKRIPNLAVLPIWFIAPVLHYFVGGGEAFIDSLLGLGVILALTFPLFAIGWLGAGDVKLMTAAGAVVLYPYALYCLAGIFISGLLLSIFLLVKKRRLGQFVRRYLDIFRMSFLTRGLHYQPPGKVDEKIVLPYAVPIAVGTLCTMLYIQVYLH